MRRARAGRKLSDSHVVVDVGEDARRRLPSRASWELMVISRLFYVTERRGRKE